MASTDSLFEGETYRGTVLGPAPAEHAGGRLKVTAIDVFDAGAMVHILFWLPPGFKTDERSLIANYQQLHNDRPKADENELRRIAMLMYLGDLLGEARASDTAGTRLRTGAFASSYLGGRALLQTFPVRPAPPSGRLDLFWEATAIAITLQSRA